MDRANASLVTIKGPQVTEFTIKNLSVFTQVLYCTVLCCTYCTVLCFTVLYCLHAVPRQPRGQEPRGRRPRHHRGRHDGRGRAQVRGSADTNIFKTSTNIFQRPAERVDPLDHEQLGGGHVGGAQAAQWGH